MTDTSTRAADPREDTPGYSPPEQAENHEWWWLAAKFAVAWLLTDLGCALFGMTNPSTGLIAAAFLVASPPVAAVRTTGWRVLAMFVGLLAGTGGAYWGLAGSSEGSAEVPLLFFVLFGVVVGAMASHRSALTYAAVIGLVVAAQGVGSDQPVLRIAVETGGQLLIGCAVGLVVIWGFEKARALLSSDT